MEPDEWTPDRAWFAAGWQLAVRGGIIFGVVLGVVYAMAAIVLPVEPSHFFMPLLLGFVPVGLLIGQVFPLGLRDAVGLPESQLLAPALAVLIGAEVGGSIIACMLGGRGMMLAVEISVVLVPISVMFSVRRLLWCS